MTTFFFDSSRIGGGPFETRVYGRFEGGELDLWLDDGKDVLFIDLHDDDQKQVTDILGASDWLRHKLVCREATPILRSIGGRK